MCFSLASVWAEAADFLRHVLHPFNQAPRADAALSDFIYTQRNYVSDVYFNLFSHDLIFF